MFGWFRDRRSTAAARALYEAIIAQSRQPAFYVGAGVPDTPDGRYDLIMLHAALIQGRLRGAGPAAQAVAQSLFDIMFADMDENLREMGVGDLAVGKRVKAMAKAFYGRIQAYNGALAAGDPTALGLALARNLYRHAEPRSEMIAAMQTYFEQEASNLAGQPLDALIDGRVLFGEPPFAAKAADERGRG